MLEQQNSKLQQEAQAAREERARSALVGAYDVLSGIKDTDEIDFTTMSSADTDDPDCPAFQGDTTKLDTIYLAQRNAVRKASLTARIHCDEASESMDQIYKHLTIRYSCYESILREGYTDTRNYRDYSNRLADIQQDLCSSIERTLNMIATRLRHPHLEMN